VKLSRYVARACRAIADKLDPSRVQVAPVLTELADAAIGQLSSDDSSGQLAEVTELEGTAVRAGYVMPPHLLADEIELREALQQALNPGEPRGQA
jgi:hypothetical protein